MGRHGGHGSALALTVALIGGAVALAPLPAAHAERGGQPAGVAVVPDQYIVTLRDSVADPESTARAIAARNGFAVLQVYSHSIKGFAAVIPASRLAALQAEPSVVSITPDRVVTIDAQALPTGIDRIDGDLSSTVSGNGAGTVNVDVAVIDTGIDLTHPDLNVYLAGAKNCSTGASANDGNGHGSHVAGTIGAKDDGSGVVGVAPGARLWPVRVLNNTGSGTWSSIICGIDFVTAHASEIEVANMSLGGSGTDSGCNGDPLHAAICRSVSAGVTYVVAAGNESDNAANHVPAAFDEVITVSALADFNGQPGGGAAATCRSDVDDTFADFSNYGPDVDLIAPGVCIRSTWKKGAYNTISGTSMASPHVAGAAALYKSSHPVATPAQVKSALQAAATQNWTTATDPDGAHEGLLNVAGM